MKAKPKVGRQKRRLERVVGRLVNEATKGGV